jgi:hypothetical protein
VFVEGFGNAGYYSVNYERFLSDPISLRAGLSFWTNGSIPFIQDRVICPILINFLTSESGHNFEVGVGAVLVLITITSYPPGITTTLSLRLGYRYQPLKGGFVFGIAFTPIPYQPIWGGISLGWAF